MLSGFNTNFRYRGVLFHVQTEDSGRGHPHVITHLFHGGNIIASEKRDYSDLLAAGDTEEEIRKLMEGQHKAMLRSLSRGERDRLISERLGPEVFDTDRAGDSPPEPTSGQADALSSSDPSDSDAVVAAPRSPVGAEPTCIVPDEAVTGSRLSRVFGDRVVSEKPLDEVVLDYLVENARKRKRSGR